MFMISLHHAQACVLITDGIKDCFEIVLLLEKVILFLNIIVYLSVFKRNNFAFKIFTLYLMFSFIIEVSTYIIRIFKENNLFLSHLFFVGQFFILSCFFYNLMILEMHKKIIRTKGVIVTILILFHFTFNLKTFYSFDLFEIFITSYAIIIFALLYLYTILDKPKQFYYITIAIVFYLISSTVLFLAGNLMNNIDSNNYIWMINIILVLIFQLIIFAEWYFNYRKNEQ